MNELLLGELRMWYDERGDLYIAAQCPRCPYRSSHWIITGNEVVRGITMVNFLNQLRLHALECQTNPPTNSDDDLSLLTSLLEWPKFPIYWSHGTSPTEIATLFLDELHYKG